jgi:hypothetical protein
VSIIGVDNENHVEKDVHRLGHEDFGEACRRRNGGYSLLDVCVVDFHCRLLAYRGAIGEPLAALRH